MEPNNKVKLEEHSHATPAAAWPSDDSALFTQDSASPTADGTLEAFLARFKLPRRRKKRRKTWYSSEDEFCKGILHDIDELTIEAYDYKYEYKTIGTLSMQMDTCVEQSTSKEERQQFLLARSVRRKEHIENYRKQVKTDEKQISSPATEADVLRAMAANADTAAALVDAQAASRDSVQASATEAERKDRLSSCSELFDEGNVTYEALFKREMDRYIDGLSVRDLWIYTKAVAKWKDQEFIYLDAKIEKTPEEETRYKEILDKIESTHRDMMKEFIETSAKEFEGKAAARAAKLTKQLKKAQEFKKQLDEQILEKKNINE